MIEMKNLNVFYGDKKVLDNISISFPEGKLTVILGPNGSGKTTLIKTAIGLVERESGEILIDGTDINNMKIKDVAKKAAYLSQSRNVPAITAEKMVLHGRFPYLGWPRHYSSKDMSIVIDSMRKTDCEHLRKRIMTDLSGGERQNVYLAMALAQDTNTIFMDEPTTYLDPGHQLGIMKRARELCNNGKTVIMVLHDLSLAFCNSDNIVIMNNGRIEESGSKSHIFNSGIIGNVFNVKVGMTENDSGCHYWVEG